MAFLHIHNTHTTHNSSALPPAHNSCTGQHAYTLLAFCHHTYNCLKIIEHAKLLLNAFSNSKDSEQSVKFVQPSRALIPCLQIPYGPSMVCANSKYPYQTADDQAYQPPQFLTLLEIRFDIAITFIRHTNCLPLITTSNLHFV